MQTFLPYYNFKKVAKCLDNKRLNKQIVEACQILNILKKIDKQGRVIEKCSKTPPWVHHPAVLMWIGYESALTFYIKECVEEWENRYNKKRNIEIKLFDKQANKPKWLTKELIISHRSNLVRKSEFYKQYNWNVDTCTPYYWPFKWCREKNSIVFIKSTNS